MSSKLSAEAKLLTLQVVLVDIHAERGARERHDGVGRCQPLERWRVQLRDSFEREHRAEHPRLGRKRKCLGESLFGRVMRNLVE